MFFYKLLFFTSPHNFIILSIIKDRLSKAKNGYRHSTSGFGFVRSESPTRPALGAGFDVSKRKMVDNLFSRSEVRRARGYRAECTEAIVADTRTDGKYGPTKPKKKKKHHDCGAFLWLVSHYKVKSNIVM